jgi:hypothetical protein
MTAPKRLFALVSCLLAGCGGGVEPGPLPFTILGITPDTVFANVSETAFAAARRVPMSVAYQGPESEPVYAVVDDPDRAIQTEPVDLRTADVTLSLTLLVAANAPPGHYTRKMTLHFCADLDCKREFKGSPRTLGKDVTVQAATASAMAETHEAAAVR